ncbi:MAG: ligase-associated DNA damage response endonuclease PdeM [Planctomycetota bacterium]|nr:ligase-associated DNA damage response endonuclease PdeM [Planctomycetota bacterium]
MSLVEVGGERLELLAGRGAFWARERALLVADLHLGKPATFRTMGIPVPEATTRADLERLDRMLLATAARRLIILGDLLHARAGRAPETLDAVARWRGARRELSVLLIRGNHDHRAGDPPPHWGFEIVDGPFPVGPFVLRHEPADDERGYVLCGHIHPAVSLRGPAGTSMRCACFWFGAGVGVLPSFGAFTGAKVVRPARGDRVFAVGPETVVEVPLAPSQY